MGLIQFNLILCIFKRLYFWKRFTYFYTLNFWLIWIVIILKIPLTFLVIIIQYRVLFINTLLRPWLIFFEKAFNIFSLYFIILYQILTWFHTHLRSRTVICSIRHHFLFLAVSFPILDYFTIAKPRICTVNPESHSIDNCSLFRAHVCCIFLEKKFFIG